MINQVENITLAASASTAAKVVGDAASHIKRLKCVARSVGTTRA